MAHLCLRAGSDLWPVSAMAEQEDVLRGLSWGDQHWSPAVAPFYFEHVVKSKFGFGAPDLALLADETGIRRYAAVLDDRLAERDFVACDRLTIADFQLASIACDWRVLKMPFEGNPNLIAWLDRLIAISIGHDLPRDDRRVGTIVNADCLADAMTGQFASLFEEKAGGSKSAALLDGPRMHERRSGPNVVRHVVRAGRAPDRTTGLPMTRGRQSTRLSSTTFACRSCSIRVASAGVVSVLFRSVAIAASLLCAASVPSLATSAGLHNGPRVEGLQSDAVGAPTARGGSQRPTVRLDSRSDSGISRSDGVTSDNKPFFSGRAKPGSTVVVTYDRQIVASATASGSGAYQIRLPKLEDGSYTFEAAQLVEPTVGIFAEEKIRLVVDTKSPSPPSVNPPGVPYDRFVTLSGTSEDAGQIRISQDGKYWGSATSYGGGRRWQVEFKFYTGLYRITAMTVDTAGNESKDVDFYLAGSKVVPILGVTSDYRSVFDLRGADKVGWFGYDVAAAGDTDGDGFGDLLIGAPIADGDSDAASGSAFIFYGQDERHRLTDFPLPNKKARLFVEVSGAAGDRSLGSVVAPAGDVNGDGFADILVGAPGPGGGYVSVVFGGPKRPRSVDVGALDGLTGFRIIGDRTNPLGAMSGGGDVNGDGTDDIVLSSGDTRGLTGSRKVFVVLGRATGFPATIRVAEMAPEDGFRIVGKGPLFGFSVASTSDIDHDGLADIVVTSPAFSRKDGDQAGEAVVVYGKRKSEDLNVSGDLERSAGFRILGLPHDKDLRSSIALVSTGGDVNGDGVDDIALSTGFKDVEQRISVGHLIFGSRERRKGDLRLQSLSNAEGRRIDLPHHGLEPISSPSGVSVDEVNIAGDLNDDGISDVLVATPGHRNRKSYMSSGRPIAFLMFGTKNLMAPFIHLAALKHGEGLQIEGRMNGEDGYSVAGVGDLDGDGREDLAIGSPKRAVSDGANGRVFGVYSYHRW